MALDSALKRGSSVNVALPWRTLPFADGTIAQADRQHTAFSYAGILAGALSLPVIPTYTANTRIRPGYANFTFPPKRFPPDYVTTR